MISAIILAAGESKRMGVPKMLLPWGDKTVIEHVVNTFLTAGIEDIVVVTGGAYNYVEKAIDQYPVRKIQNPNYAAGEMISSIQCGLREMPERTLAALIGLGDQPQIQGRNISAICDAYKKSRSPLVIPSFQMKRGHPWLVARPFWQKLLGLQAPQTPRDFLKDHSDQIQYVNLDTPAILADLDTPDDYEKSRP
ncbi:MAG TPA: nucleotidyltransferase family protein [Anaerolineales bacterium]|nr:nucleotidyltransferase family protein [Anaerolineales bacterium]